MAKTLDATPLDDLWQYDLATCPKNCSLHGNCHYGSCRCHDSYYGEDCSNSTCPGSYCFYDDIEHKQSCNHCCFSGFEHNDNDTYVAKSKSTRAHRTTCTTRTVSVMGLASASAIPRLSERTVQYVTAPRIAPVMGSARSSSPTLGACVTTAGSASTATSACVSTTAPTRTACA